jgi:ADP-heptose:LPS heptosyltransferase
VTPGDPPVQVPYVAVDATRRGDAVRAIRGAAGGRAAVGIAWSGAKSNTNDARRSFALATLAPLLRHHEIAWFSLQHDDEAHIAAVPGASAALVRLAERVDFDAMAAMIDALDLVITVDTSIAHVAGALGKPVWILLPFASDWRWGLASDASAWYPTARLFRQHRVGDWHGVVARVEATLSEVPVP